MCIRDSPTPYQDLDADKPDNEKFMQDYMSYVYTILDEAGYLLNDNIDTSDELSLIHIWRPAGTRPTGKSWSGRRRRRGRRICTAGWPRWIRHRPRRSTLTM